MTADATARYVITAEDRTRAATESAKRNFDSLSRSFKDFRQVLGTGIAGLSIVGFTKYAMGLAQIAQDARDATDSIEDMRTKMGQFAATLTDQDLQRLGDLADKIDETKAAFDRLVTGGLATATPLINGFLDSVRRLAGGAYDTEKLDEQINFLERMQGRSFLAAGYGDIGTGFFTASEGAAKLAELRAKRAALQGQIDGRASGSIVGEMDGITVTGTRTGDGGDARRTADTIRRLQQERAELNETTRLLSNTGYADSLDENLFKPLIDGVQNVEVEISGGLLPTVEAATDEMSVYAEEAARNMHSAFADFLFDPFEGGLKGMLRNFVDVIRRMAAEAASAKIFDALKGAGGGGGGFFGAIGDFLGFATGGSFTVGGSGGTDSQLVAFRATPGERVDVRTPAQQRDGGGGVSIVTNIDARGATQELAAQLPRILEQNNRQVFATLQRAMPGVKFA